MASRSQPQAYTGAICPEHIRFDFVHGPSASTGTVVLPGNFQPAAGTPLGLWIGNSLWYGFVIDWRFDTETQSTTIQACDWRDRLHDTHIFAAFNMQEDDGRVYHQYPHLWRFQRRTYISRELDQFDFNAIQNYPPESFMTTAIAGQNVLSAFTIMRWFAFFWNFRVFVDPMVARILQTTYPMNLDWNNGARVVDAIQQLLDKCGLQMCCIGTDMMYLTLRGFTANPFLRAFLNGHLNYCNLGANSASVGEQLHDKGRRILIQGDRNRYEFVFVCKANWNPRWTWDFAYGGFGLGALLESVGLTHLNKVKELPPEFHDNETWTENNDLRGRGAATLRRKRNEMTIEEYINKIVFKCYIVDFSTCAFDWAASTDGPFRGLAATVNRDNLSFTGESADIAAYNRWPIFSDRPGFNSRWPISNKLASESNLQYLVHSTSRKIVQGVENPFYHQLTFVPKLEGANLDVEEVLGADGVMQYRARIFFNEPQFYMTPGVADPSDPNFITPDLVLCRLSLDGDVFAYAQGEAHNGPRVREHKINVPNLARAFVNNTEIGFLSSNFVSNLRDQGARPAFAPVRAQDIAISIATQQLFRQALVRSGDLRFLDRTGTLPDGVIESVSVNWDHGAVEELVNFATAPGSRREVIPPSVLRMAYKFLDETELNRRRLLWAARIALSEMRGEAGREVTFDDFSATFGGDFAPHKSMAHYSKDGAVVVRYSAAAVGPSMSTANSFMPGDVVVTQGARWSGNL